MRIWIAAIGARPRQGFDELARMYLERIAALLPGGSKTSTVETPLFRSEDGFWRALERERARTAPLVILLDERGKQMSSEAFAAWLGREFDAGRQLIVFAVGPAEGWEQSERRAQSSGMTNPAREEQTLRLSLGPMTLAHELARVVLCEQVYRALTILRGHPYHRSG